MDDLSRRVGNLETGIAEIRAKLDAVLPHLATKADLHALEARMHVIETRMIKWIVGAQLTGIAIAVGIAQVISHFLK